MTCAQVKQLRGLKPPKEVTVRNALRGLQSRLRMKAPVVEAMISTEEEEKIKDELFSRPSPTPDEEVKSGEGTLVSPALSPIHSPVQRLHNEDDLSEEREDHSLEHSKDKLTPPDIEQGNLPSTEEDEMAEGCVSEPSIEESKLESGHDIEDVPLNAVDSESGLEDSNEILQSVKGEEEKVTGAGEKVEREVIEVDQTGENQSMEIIEDNVVDGEEEPKNMVKLVFKEKRDSNEESEVTSGQPQNDAYRSLSATISPEEKNEDVEKKTGEEEKMEEEEEEVVVVDEEMGEKQLPCLDHLLTWAASASPSDRLKLMNNVAEVQAKLFNIHMK